MVGLGQEREKKKCGCRMKSSKSKIQKIRRYRRNKSKVT